MDKFIYTLDQFLLGHAQKISDYLQSRFGTTCKQISRFFWVLILASNILTTYAIIQMKFYGLLIVHIPFVTLIPWMIWKIINKFSENLESISNKNPREIEWFIIRGIFESICVGIFAGICAGFYIVRFLNPSMLIFVNETRAFMVGMFLIMFFSLCIMLFLSCTPKPPKTKRAEKRSLLSLLKLPQPSLS